MTDDHRESTSDHPEFTGSLEDQILRLELQLQKTRSEASAKRLEARAAEIELLIRELGGGARSGSTQSDTPINPPHLRLASTQPRFQNWDELRQVYGLEAPVAATADAQSDTITRVDASVARIKRPYLLDVCDSDSGLARDPEDGLTQFEPTALAAGVKGGVDQPPSPEASACGSVKKVEAVSVEADPDSGNESERRQKKPIAWFASAGVHLALLAVLAAITLQTHQPKDQVALSASAPEAAEVSMETFTIESQEPEVEPTEATPSETEYELSPVGEIAATEFTLDAPPAPPAVTAISSSQLSESAATTLTSESSTPIEFCGIEGGGNHFVYLVDSSGSMGEAFTSARAELLASIAALKPHQRFYVVFFDADSDYMRLSDPRRDEPRSVRATAENCAALKRWAMQIEMDRGRAPYEALRFALKLRPDVIFLLSDGEFPQGIEELLREENKVENLFGDSHPISIVHTIGYHSREGESRMRRIAQQNKGQYKHVPKP